MYIWLKITFLFLVLILYPRQAQESMLYPDITTPFISASQGVETPQSVKNIPLKEIKRPLAIVASATDDFRQDIIDYICSKDWNCQIAVNIFTCESNLRPDAHNYNPKTKDDSWGITQINLWDDLAKNRPLPELLMDWKFNIDYAFTMWQKQGFNPWSCNSKLNKNTLL